MDIERQHIEGLISGSYKDFTYLYELYAARLYAFVSGLAHDEALAKDIVQDTFVKVWVRREQINPEQSFNAYLFTMARNQLLNEFRRQLNQATNMNIEELSNSGSLAENNTERGLYLEDFNHQLAYAKQKLTPRQRELFELNKELGLSVNEIACRTSISEQSIRNQLSQALQVLRKEMKQYYYLFAIFFLR